MHINWLNVWTGGSVVLLVGTEVALLSEAAAWALAGLVGLAPEIATVLYLLAGGLALAATVAFARLVHGAEPFFDRLPSPSSARRGAEAPDAQRR